MIRMIGTGKVDRIFSYKDKGGEGDPWVIAKIFWSEYMGKDEDGKPKRENVYASLKLNGNRAEAFVKAVKVGSVIEIVGRPRVGEVREIDTKNGKKAVADLIIFGDDWAFPPSSQAAETSAPGRIDEDNEPATSRSSTDTTDPFNDDED